MLLLLQALIKIRANIDGKGIGGTREAKQCPEKQVQVNYLNELYQSTRAAGIGDKLGLAGLVFCTWFYPEWIVFESRASYLSCTGFLNRFWAFEVSPFPASFSLVNRPFVV